MSLALALALANVRWLLPTLVVAHIFTCWPAVYNLYCAPGAYRIENVPIRAALRLEPEDTYLRQDPEYAVTRMLGSVVPPSEPIFAITQGGQAYLPRQLLIGYESASNELLEDILWTPVFRVFQPTRIVKFDFAPRELRKLRVVQTASLPYNQWSIAELRVFGSTNTELARDLPGGSPRTPTRGTSNWRSTIVP